ncbi:MAG: hypothetical protein JNK79_04430 [Chitinophagaceae bacterium]|nr:hypothetical protein [Chitinophagaceae bacterium]
MNFKYLISAGGALFLSLASCKKESESPKEELPELGTCVSVSPSGRLAMSGTNSFTYITPGGGEIYVDLEGTIVIKHNFYENFKLEFWGGIEDDSNPIISANHENLNGKHIKDRIGKNWSIIFPDGVKVTFTSAGKDQPVLSVSIYDGSEIHHFNATCHSLEYSSTSSPFVNELDALQPDGETSTFEFTDTGLTLWNIYIEDAVNKRVEKRQRLGELSRDNPNQVNDYYDDAKLDHT